MIDNLAIAALVSVAMIGSYLWGYRDGVRYCAKQLAPLDEAAKQIGQALRDSKDRRR